MDLTVTMPGFVPIFAQSKPHLMVLGGTCQAVVAGWDNPGCHQLQVEPPLTRNSCRSLPRCVQLCEVQWDFWDLLCLLITPQKAATVSLGIKTRKDVEGISSCPNLGPGRYTYNLPCQGQHLSKQLRMLENPSFWCPASLHHCISSHQLKLRLSGCVTQESSSDWAWASPQCSDPTTNTPRPLFRLAPPLSLCHWESVPCQTFP